MEAYFASLKKSRTFCFQAAMLPHLFPRQLCSWLKSTSIYLSDYLCFIRVCSCYFWTTADSHYYPDYDWTNRPFSHIWPAAVQLTRHDLPYHAKSFGSSNHWEDPKVSVLRFMRTEMQFPNRILCNGCVGFDSHPQKPACATEATWCDEAKDGIYCHVYPYRCHSGRLRKSEPSSVWRAVQFTKTDIRNWTDIPTYVYSEASAKIVFGFGGGRFVPVLMRWSQKQGTLS